jgi:Tfp pilus assembly protein PilV
MRGISIIEVLVAIFIFSIGALTALTMSVTSMQTNNHSEAVDAHSNIARMKMEQLLSAGYATLQDSNGDGAGGLLNDQAANADASETIVIGTRSYNTLWNVATDTPERWSKTVSVIVTWSGSRGEKRVVYQTIVTE